MDKRFGAEEQKKLHRQGRLPAEGYILYLMAHSSFLSHTSLARVPLGGLVPSGTEGRRKGAAERVKVNIHYTYVAPLPLAGDSLVRNSELYCKF